MKSKLWFNNVRFHKHLNGSKWRNNTDHPYDLLIRKAAFLLGLKRVMLCISATAVLLEPTVILQVKVCDAPNPLSSTSLCDKIVSVETWDFVSGSKIPSIRTYPSVVAFIGIQTTPLIFAGMSVKLQLIAWSSTTYTTFNVSASTLASGNFQFIILINNLFGPRHGLNAFNIVSFSVSQWRRNSMNCIIMTKIRVVT